MPLQCLHCFLSQSSHLLPEFISGITTTPSDLKGESGLKAFSLISSLVLVIFGTITVILEASLQTQLTVSLLIPG